MTYEINLVEYKGPMDLLLDLIKKHKIDIYDIPISLVTEQFLDYIQKAEEINLELTSDFILMASTLLEIKSKLLLPKPTKEDDEEDEDPRHSLVKRIIEYEKIQNAAQQLKEYSEIESMAFYRQREEFFDIEGGDLIKDGNVINLTIAFEKLLKSKIKKEDYNMNTIVQKDRYTVENTLNKIRYKFKESPSFYFSEMVENVMDREELIVFFLSLLELIKNREAAAEQNDLFDDILIKARKKEMFNAEL